MLKKTVETTNFEGEKIVETLYFNLTKAEVQRMEVNGKYGSLAEHFKTISGNKDGRQTLAAFESIILQAYGERSEDGKRLLKSEEISQNFSVTEAYSDLLFEISTSSEKALGFFKAITPKEIGDSINVQAEAGKPQDYRQKQD